MHFHKPATVWLLALATGQFISGRAIGAEATHWGQPVSGMRAGVAIAAGKSGLELIVDFQNVGSRAFSLRIASGAAMGSGYDFSTWAVSPEGTSVELYFRPGVSVGGILKVGLPYFLVEQIPPGGTYEITQPVTAIVATGKEPGTGGTPLQTLLRQSYKVGISYRMDPDHRQTKRLVGRYPDLWVGALESGAAGLDNR